MRGVSKVLVDADGSCHDLEGVGRLMDSELWGGPPSKESCLHGSESCRKVSPSHRANMGRCEKGSGNITLT